MIHKICKLACRNNTSASAPSKFHLHELAHHSCEKKGGRRIPAGKTIYINVMMRLAAGDNKERTSFAGGLKYAFTVEGNISQPSGSRFRPSCAHFFVVWLILKRRAVNVVTIKAKQDNYAELKMFPKKSFSSALTRL